MEFEPVIRAELMLQARPGRRHADAFLQRRQRVLGQTDAVVADFEAEHVVLAAGDDIDMTCA